MSAVNFGATFNRESTEILPAIGSDFSTVAIIETSEDATESKYPLNTPVRISTGDPDAVAALGSGLLQSYVTGINDQLTSLNSGADVTIIRVAEGVDVEATSANIADQVKTLDKIAPETGATPRIVLAGRTAWRPDNTTSNPVVSALETMCPKILATAVVDVDETTKEAATDARETMSSQRIIPIGVAARVYEGSEVVTRPMSPRVAGLIMRVDNSHAGYPFEPFANRPIYGLAGVSRNIPFSMTDGSSEGQMMLGANVSIVVRGETGVDGAISDGGYTFIGTDSASSKVLEEQVHQTRGVDYIVTQILKLTREFLGRKVTADLVEAWINSVDAALRDHKAANRILGYTPKQEMFKRDLNSPEQLRLGSMNLSIGIEQAAEFHNAGYNLGRYRPALIGLVDDIIANLAAA